MLQLASFLSVLINMLVCMCLFRIESKVPSDLIISKGSYFRHLFLCIVFFLCTYLEKYLQIPTATTKNSHNSILGYTF